MLAEREACILEKLRRFEWAPDMLCSKGSMIVMRHMGQRVDKYTLPENFKAQMQKILNDMNSLRIRHNDIVTKYRTDLMVRDGRLGLIDFNYGSIGGDFSCGSKLIPRKVPCFTQKRDSNVIRALEMIANEQARWRRSMQDNSTPMPPPIANNGETVRHKGDSSADSDDGDAIGRSLRRLMNDGDGRWW